MTNYVTYLTSSSHVYGQFALIFEYHFTEHCFKPLLEKVSSFLAKKNSCKSILRNVASYKRINGTVFVPGSGIVKTCQSSDVKQVTTGMLLLDNPNTLKIQLLTA